MRRTASRATTVLPLLALLIGTPGTALGADLPQPPPAQAIEPVVAPPGWTFRFTPYGWLISLDGKQTVRGRTVDVDASFIDIIHDTIGRGGTLIGLMGDVEARHGPLALFGDAVWTKIGLSGSRATTRSVAPGIVGSLGAAADLKIQMAIVEGGAAYELGRFAVPFGDRVSIPAAFDVLAGGRFWYQKADVSFNLAGTVDVGDLVLTRDRAIARSGSVDWIDPFIGGRVRLAVAPGQEIFIRGDIGGFGAGSQFSWQAIAGYGFDFATRDGIIYSGVIGYRALSVDYAQGSGRTRYEFDMVEHGPVLGISVRF